MEEGDLVVGAKLIYPARYCFVEDNVNFLISFSGKFGVTQSHFPDSFTWELGIRLFSGNPAE